MIFILLSSTNVNLLIVHQWYWFYFINCNFFD